MPRPIPGKTVAKKAPVKKAVKEEPKQLDMTDMNEMEEEEDDVVVLDDEDDEEDVDDEDDEDEEDDDEEDVDDEDDEDEEDDDEEDVEDEDVEDDSDDEEEDEDEDTEEDEDDEDDEDIEDVPEVNQDVMGIVKVIPTGTVRYGQSATIKVRDTEHMKFECNIELPFEVGEEDNVYKQAKKFVEDRILVDVKAAKQISQKK